MPPYAELYHSSNTRAERYRALKWAQNAFDDFRVVPPGTGIVHQVNLEYLGQVVHEREQNGDNWLFPDTLVGTDSHTPMIGGIGVVGWGVGGIKAEAAMLGQPITMNLPEVVGVKLMGELPEGGRFLLAGVKVDSLPGVREVYRLFKHVTRFERVDRSPNRASVQTSFGNQPRL